MYWTIGNKRQQNWQINCTNQIFNYGLCVSLHLLSYFRILLNNHYFIVNGEQNDLRFLLQLEELYKRTLAFENHLLNLRWFLK